LLKLGSIVVCTKNTRFEYSAATLPSKNPPLTVIKMVYMTISYKFVC